MKSTSEQVGAMLQCAGAGKKGSNENVVSDSSGSGDLSVCWSFRLTLGRWETAQPPAEDFQL